ncbi:MAG: Holliday junction DNA helicase RuvB C-terminal domain-containing protein [Candidatus Thorarchaeota archaeon]|jgi:Holliday junction DNA helicase RuvB
MIDHIYEQHLKDLEEASKMVVENFEDSPMEVVIKPDQLDINKIKEYKGEGFRKFEFRPQKWEQFIGQHEAKERAKTIIKKIKKGLKSHFLVDGIKGHGKTTYCELLAKDIHAHFIKRIGKQINIDNIVDIINEINTSDKQYVIWFVDEFDTMDKKVIKVLNPIIESFEISGKQIKPFIFVGATINKHILLKNNPDTLDRIPTHIKFKRYTEDEIKQILNQYIKQLYSAEQIELLAINHIARNCKFNPRTSIALLEEYIVEKDIKKVLLNCHILKDGLNEHDIKILRILNQSQKPIGANCLALKCGLSQDEYLREFEPYLLEYNYINRVPSRIITDKGKQILESLNV